MWIRGDVFCAGIEPGTLRITNFLSAALSTTELWWRMNHRKSFRTLTNKKSFRTLTNDNLNFPRTPSPTMHASCHSAHFPKEWGARHSAVCIDGRCPSFSACYLMTHFLTMHMYFCLRECTLKQGCQHKKRCTVQRHANAMRNGTARGDGNTRRDCWMKIEFRVALTVKHPKTLPLAPRSLRCFPNPLLILDLSTPALSRSFWKGPPISAFLAPYRPPTLRALNWFNLTLPRFSPTPFCS